MHRYITRRLLQTVPVLFLVTLVPFSLLLLLPGDPVIAILGGGAGIEVDPLLVRQIHRQLALGDPIPVQYARWLARALRGDFGKELSSGTPALKLVANRLPATLELTALAVCVAFAVGVTLGMIAAVYRGTLADVAASTLALAGLAVPGFWLALLLILLFSVQLGWFKVIGYVSLAHDPVASLRSMVLPALALGSGGAAIIARMTRSSMLEVLSQDYVRTARSKGLRESTVLLRHALHNALLPVLTVAGLQVSALLSGSVIIESIFSLPGVGRLLIQSILHREFFVVQCAVLIIAVGVVATNLLVDIAYRYVDPRIKYD